MDDASLGRAEAHSQMKRWQRRVRNMIKDDIDQVTINAAQGTLNEYTTCYDALLDLADDDDDDGGGGGGGGGGGASGGGIIANGELHDYQPAA